MIAQQTATASRADRRSRAHVPMKARPRAPMKISDHALALSRVKRGSGAARIDPFLPYRPMPGVVPKIAMDDAFGSGGFQHGAWAYGGLLSTFEEGQAFLGYPELSVLAQRPEYRVMTETIATEMTRKWIEFNSAGDEDKSKKIAAIKDEFDRLDVRSAFRKVTEHDGYFGRGHLYLDTGDGENRDELIKPIGDGRNTLSRAKVGKQKRLLRVEPIEPVWCYPQNYNATDPLERDWYAPSVWYVQAKMVHVSRLLNFVAREVPDLLKPAYAFGGLSLSQMAKPYVDNWLVTRQSVQDLIKSFTTFVLKTNMPGIIGSIGEADFLKRLDMFDNNRRNSGVMAIDKESEDFANVSASLGGLDHLQAQSQEHMAAVSRIPLVKLTGISPSGLNASSDGELRCFEDVIHAKQEAEYRPHLTTILGFVQLSLFGEVDPDITFEFLPINELTEKEKAELREVEARTGQILVDVGAVSQEEERARIANDPDTPYPGLVIEDLPDLGEEEQDGLIPKGGREGGIGGERPSGEGSIHAQEGSGSIFGKDEAVNFDALFAEDAFEENKHKRNAGGQFSSTGVGGGSGNKTSRPSPLEVKEKAAKAAKSAKPKPAPKPKKEATAPKPLTGRKLTSFAKTVNEFMGRHKGEKMSIGDLYQKTQFSTEGRTLAGSPDEFKANLAAAAKEGKIELERHDTAEGKPDGSEMLLGREEKHYVVKPAAKAKAAPKPSQPKAEKPKAEKKVIAPISSAHRVSALRQAKNQLEVDEAMAPLEKMTKAQVYEIAKEYLGRSGDQRTGEWIVDRHKTKPAMLREINRRHGEDRLEASRREAVHRAG